MPYRSQFITATDDPLLHPPTRNAANPPTPCSPSSPFLLRARSSYPGVNQKPALASSTVPAASFLSYPAGRPNAANPHHCTLRFLACDHPPRTPSTPATGSRGTRRNAAKRPSLFFSPSARSSYPGVNLTRPNVPPLHPLLPRPLLLPPGRLLHPPLPLYRSHLIPPPRLYPAAEHHHPP